MSDGEPLVELTPAWVAALWRLPDEADGVVLCGSGCRVPAAMARQWETGPGPLDKTFAECAAVTGIPVKTLANWRKTGLLQVRVTSTSRTQGLLVVPAELVRVLRLIAERRNGTCVLAETPSQARRRGEKDRQAALDACDGR